MQRLPHGELDPDYVNFLYNKHLNGQTLSSIAREINRDPSSVSKLFSKRNLKINKITDYSYYKTYSNNDDYFECINSHEKAYILGFLYADGTICKRTEYSYSISIALQNRDRHILEYIKNCLEYSGPLTYKSIKGHEICTLSISSKKIGEDLIKLGMLPRKTYIDFNMPDIKNEYINSFLYGYFDGDGSIYNFYNKQKREYTGISICALNKNILQDFRIYLEKNNIQSRVRIDRRNSRNEKLKDIYLLLITKQLDIYKFINLITRDFNMGLQRKLKKINYANTVLTEKFKNFSAV